MRTRPNIARTLALAVPLALAVAACSGGGGGGGGGGAATPGAAAPSAAGTVVIGASLSLTGPLDELGPPLEAGYQQEIADVNAAGGVAVGGTKHTLRLVVLDNGSDPATASSQVRELVQRDHAVALLGFATPQIVMPAALTAEQLRVPFLTSLMPVEAFANGDKDGWKYAWDLFCDERQQAADAARALAAVPGDKKVVLFTDNDADGAADRPAYQAAFKAAGLDLVGDYTFPAGTVSFSSFIAAAKARGAQLLAGQVDQADGTALWKQAKALGFHPKAALLTAAPDAAPWWQSLGSIAQGTLAAGYWAPGQAQPGQLALITPTLGKRYAGSPGYAAAAVGYAVAEVLTGAIAAAGSTSAAKLTAAIGQTSRPTTAGPIRFNPVTHTADTPSYVTQWQGSSSR